VAAGLAMLEMAMDGDVYDLLEKRSRQIEEGLRGHLKRLGLHLCLQRVGSMWTLFFQSGPVQDWPSAARSDTARFAAFFRGLLARGVYIAPSQYEACFTSAAHDEAIVEETIDAAGAALAEAFA
jgi:glutamate-1-semialdehyde 2,1-aminomutase